MRLAQKIAIITGGSNGIGRATALLFAQEGASVVVADRDMAAGEACAETIRSAGGVAIFFATDVSKDDDVAQLVSATVDRYGGLDIIMNNVGISIRGSVVDTEPARWQRVIDVNLTSVYRGCKYAIPEMIRRGGGAIVNVASLQGLYGYSQWAAYAAAKAGIIGLTRQVAVDYARYQIRSNAISPGGIMTQNKAERTVILEPEFAAGPANPTPPAIANAPTPESESQETLRTYLRRAGQPKDIAYAALFLASDEAGHVSGQNLVVDGGASAWVG